jgi:hypothetical protein
MTRISGLTRAALPVILTAVAAVALANVVLLFGPSIPGTGVPAYARIERAPDGSALVHHDKDWAAIPFYRLPSCVPEGFNLLDFFDAPAAFGCPMTVEGFEIWKNGPWAGDAAPIQTVSHGLGNVPVWFVPWDALKRALADNTLTMSELEGLSPLKGTASYFKETLHPAGAAQRTKTQIVAQGLLPDGRSFNFQSEENESQLKAVIIHFR